MEKLGSNLGPETAIKTKASAPERVKIILEENDNIPPTGLFVGLNGLGFIIRPGEIVSVPRGVVEILDHAVESRPTIDPTSRRVTGTRIRTRFPYKLVA